MKTGYSDQRKASFKVPSENFLILSVALFIRNIFMFEVPFILSSPSSALLIAPQSAWLLGDHILKIGSSDCEVFLNHIIMPSTAAGFSRLTTAIKPSSARSNNTRFTRITTVIKPSSGSSNNNM